MLEVRVLGGPALRIDGRDLPFPAGRPGRLLVSLLLARGRVVPTGQLYEDVWPDSEPGDPRAALHTTVARLRRSLGAYGSAVQRSGAGYRLDAGSLDADTFTALATDHAHESADTRRTRLETALALWQGGPWGEFAADLAFADTQRLTALHTTLREDYAETLLGTGQVRATTDLLRTLVAEQPLRERRVELLLLALERVGATEEALACYATYRERLADEQGLDPAPHLRDLHTRILRREHTRNPTVRAPTVGELFGRDTHLSVIDQHRWVTVVGPGGVGKTSAAAATATRRAHWWADLAEVATPEAVWHNVIDAVGAQTVPGGDLEPALRHRFSHLEGVLVLDNCEHVPVAAARIARLALAVSADLRVLATSRRRMGLPEEQVFALPPLRLPSVDDDESPAVALFRARAEAVCPDFRADPDAIARLVRRLDGLPLAIELAAGRMGTMTLADLDRRPGPRLDLLRSAAPFGARRQHTLTATITWSYDLLDPDEARALRWIAVFTGRFDLPAAEALLGARAADLVSRLVENSLLTWTGTGLYRLLDTVRDFARGHTDADELDRIRRAHARWVAEQTALADAGMHGPDEKRWATIQDALAREAAAVATWALPVADPVLIDIVVAVRHWAYLRLRPDILRWACELHSAHPADSALSSAAATYSWLVGDHDRAHRYGRAAVEQAEPGTRAEWVALDILSDELLTAGDFGAAAAMATRAHAQARARDDLTATAMSTVSLALAVIYAGQDPTALLARAHDEAARANNPTCYAWLAYTEGEAYAQIDDEKATAALESAAALASTVGNRIVAGVSRTAAASLHARSATPDLTTITEAVDALKFWAGSGNDQLLRTCLRNLIPLFHHLALPALAVELSATAHTHLAAGAEATRLTAILTTTESLLTAQQRSQAHTRGAHHTPDTAAHLALTTLTRIASDLTPEK
ncbi:BTAD domain-containing putative transcriptional regulator [Nocardia lasii]|uniref:BTAD domain-containing putative transcriptional regulator n=1 Tax=Nocardia lasii TaxID=1616107 RepID=A0ABW1JLD1_9NOCA